MALQDHPATRVLPTDLELKDRIVQAFGQRYEASACIPDLASEISIPSVDNREKLELLRRVMGQMVNEGLLSREDLPGDDANGLRAIYRLSR